MAIINIDNKPYEVDPEAEPPPRLPVAGLRPAVLLLAPGDGFGRRLPPVRGKSLQGRERHGRQDRHVLHDARGGRHAHLHRRSRGDERSARASSKWLMVNHPHDCPVCDEGGECHLQDMTVMTGHDLPPLPLRQAHAPQPGPRALRQPRDEPLHPVLPLRPLLPRLRRRQRPRRVRGAHNHVYFGRARGRRAGERVQRQPRGGLPHRRLHRQDAEEPLHAQVGPADRAVGLRALRVWAATRCPASAMARCGASSTATTAR